MFFRPVLVCFWQRACELNAVRREEHLYAERCSSSTLTEAAVADDGFKRDPICAVPDITAKATAVVKITHRISWPLALTGLD